jgi:hypothetical protein
LNKSNLWFKERLIHEDVHWLFFAVKKIESIAFTNDYCYIRYFVPDSIMTNTNLFPSIQGMLILLEDMTNNLDLDLLKDELSYIHWQISWNKQRILSDERYRGLLNKCASLEHLVDIYFSELNKISAEDMLTKVKRKLKSVLKKAGRKIPFAQTIYKTLRGR